MQMMVLIAVAVVVVAVVVVVEDDGGGGHCAHVKESRTVRERGGSLEMSHEYSLHSAECGPVPGSARVE